MAENDASQAETNGEETKNPAIPAVRLKRGIHTSPRFSLKSFSLA